jgi:hypothetical protein
MLGRRQMMHQEGTNGTRNRDFKEQLCLGNERTTRGIYRKSTGLEIAKRIARCTVGLQRIKRLDLAKGSNPSKTKKKKKTAYRQGTGNVEALLRELTGLHRVSLGMSVCKEGVVAMVQE